jgi:hypothetical protein
MVCLKQEDAGKERTGQEAGSSVVQRSGEEFRVRLKSEIKRTSGYIITEITVERK